MFEEIAMHAFTDANQSGTASVTRLISECPDRVFTVLVFVTLVCAAACLAGLLAIACHAFRDAAAGRRSRRSESRADPALTPPLILS